MLRKCIYVLLAAILYGEMSIACRAVDELQPGELAVPFSTVPLNILDADYGGTGCPEGSASVVVIGNMLSILFDEYVATTSYGRQTDRKSCNYAVALAIEQGYTVALLEIDYRGFAHIPSGGMGVFTAEYFWAGQHGPMYYRAFPPGFFGNWQETDFVGGDAWSPCGGEVIARSNTSVLARKSSPDGEEEAEVSVDSLDLEAEIIYYFEWDAC